MNLLEIVDIGKEVDGQIILEKINLSIKDGEFFSLLGSSGCGKTTLLRLIAGLDSPTSGEIRLDGKRVDHLPPQKRPFKMVFQKYALFPHLSVFDNVAFGPRIQKLPEEEVRTRCQEALEIVGLKAFAARKPETLSGGQAQRVAVARAVVNRPRVLLLDEPLSALDQKMREHMQTELRALQRRLSLTFIYVTHDQEEAMVLSDRIGVMNGGCLEQVATPRELYNDPKSFFVASFVGQMMKLPGQIEAASGEFWRIGLANNEKILAKKKIEHLDARAVAFVRPEKIQVLTTAQPEPPNFNSLSGTITQVIFRGDQTEVEVDCRLSTKISAWMLSGAHNWQVGESVKLCFSPSDTWLFDEAAT